MTLIYDAHKYGLRPKGMRTISTLLAASLFGNYYYYTIIPYNAPYLIGTAVSTFLLGIMTINTSMMRNATIAEMALLPTKDMVRITLMNGKVFDCNIKDLKINTANKARI